MRLLLILMLCGCGYISDAQNTVFDQTKAYSVKSDEYPYVLVMDIVSSFDRSGDFRFMTSDKVYLKKFSE